MKTSYNPPCLNASFRPQTQIQALAWRAPDVRSMPVSMLLQTTRGKTALEIGGPTPQLNRRCCNTTATRRFYSDAMRFDNVVEHVHAEWAKDRTKSIFTNDYRANGAALQAVARDNFYDTVVSSHNIEHFPDPLRALLEWHRVLKPGGRIVLIIPYPPKTFDHARKPNTILHLLADWKNSTRERHTFDLEATFASWERNTIEHAISLIDSQ